LGEGLLLNVRRNHGDHPIECLDRLVIPETKDAKALGFQPCSSHSVRLIVMLAAIQLDDQPALHVEKIDTITAKCRLPPELGAAELAIAQR
jgi:hypothetical protein